MDGGKAIRFKRLFHHSSRLFLVPMDHGVTLGPVPGLAPIRQSVAAVAKGGADAIIVHKGLAKQLAAEMDPHGCELIVHLSASTALSPDANRKELVTSVEHALRLGATAVSVHINLAAAAEARMLRGLGVIAEKCDLWGMPLLAMMYVRDGTTASEFDPQKIKHAARVAEEMGVDLIKVNYTGSPATFAEVTSAVKTPVIIAGGPRMGVKAELLKMIAEAVQAGARGAAIGRNVFQDPDPETVAREIREILDHGIPQAS